MEGCRLRALNQHIEDLALVVDRPPQIHPLVGDPDDHLVKMPAIARPRTVPGETGVAAVKLIRKLLRKQGFAPKMVVTDKLRSYGAAFHHIGLACHHEQELRSRVDDDWRGGLRFARLYCFRQLSPVPVSQFAP